MSGFVIPPAAATGIGSLPGTESHEWATTIAGGDGSRMPSEADLAGALWQGRNVAQIAKKLTA